MKDAKIILSITFIIHVLLCFGQKNTTITDTSFKKTTVVKQKKFLDTVILKTSWYGRAMPYSIYAGPGKMKDRVSQNIEFGRSINVVDVGIVYGRISERPDSTQYLEGKVTMDACQYGIFSNEFSIGAGRVFNSKTPILLEFSYTLLAQFARDFGAGVVMGYYDISGETRGENKNFFGIFIRCGLQRDLNGILMNKKMRMHHHFK
jgi:hypothetical protein